MSFESRARPKLSQLVGAIATLICITGMIGCGDSDLGYVRGTITLDGKPLPNAFVKFLPRNDESTGTTTFGKTGEDGSYQMFFSDDKAGVCLGKNLVRITTGDVSVDGPIKEAVPNCYNSKSDVYVNVEPGNNTCDFDLKSDASAIKQINDRR